MAAQLRELRQRIRATKSVGKVTKAMELIATSRIGKAQARVTASRPYADEIVRVLTALATNATQLDDPLLTERENPRRAAVIVVTSDKGQCGGYNANVLRRTEELLALLREQGKEPELYVTGRKGSAYYRFRNRQPAGEWEGFSELPHYENAAEVGRTVVEQFRAGGERAEDGSVGVDEVHLVYTEFVSMLTQTPAVVRLAPLEVTYDEPSDEQAQYEFEPEPEELLASLLPKYVSTRIFAAMLESAASELAARRTAMKAASDNANELVDTLTREANQARQAQITQEISEIVGGANALAAVGSED